MVGSWLGEKYVPALALMFCPALLGSRLTRFTLFYKSVYITTLLLYFPIIVLLSYEQFIIGALGFSTIYTRFFRSRSKFYLELIKI